MSGIIKLKIKLAARFFRNVGLGNLTLSGIHNALRWRFSHILKPRTCRKIIWLGPFSPIHANVGDHAQTLAVQHFLADKFSDCNVVRIYRDDINEARLKKVAETLRPDDLIFIQSSGDFGSLHDTHSHHSGRLSFPEVRRQIVKLAPDNKIINLPVTAYYEDTESGKESLAKDSALFNNSNLTVLCREEESLKTLRANLTCRSLFFPDFVFYLKPKPVASERKGALVIIRDDKEARITAEGRKQIVSALEDAHFDVMLKDVMHAMHAVPDFILDEYIESVFREFQRRELVITDKMHGMITAVITRTPCIALSSGIPHKIKAYKSFLSGAVEFVEAPSDVDAAIQRIKNREYSPVDMTAYYSRFRKEIAGG